MTQDQCAAMWESMSGMMGSGSGMMGGWGWGGMVWFGLLLVAIVAVAIVLAVVLVRRPASPAGEDPREILRRRFARGEINGDEFDSAKRTLG